MAKYTVKLSAVGNPDFDEPKDIGVPSKQVPVDSYAEASKVAQAFIAEHDLGGGNWSGGQILEGSKVVARVSYNGKVWEPNAHDIHALPGTPKPSPLFDPYGNAVAWVQA